MVSPLSREPFAAPPEGQEEDRKPTWRWGVAKKLIELLICFIHPLAVILMWINLAGRTDLTPGSKVAWGIFGIIPLVPFIYVLTGGDLF